jgi:DNA helicase II / ATP-dependent DNA helicase PcrA
MARTILCGHCGDSHGSVAEVRACSAGGPLTAGASPSRPALGTEADPSTRPRRTPPGGDGAVSAPLPLPVETLAGPDRLGRCLLVRPGAIVPDPWAAAPVVRLQAAATDPALVARLHTAWSRRERLVVELEGELPGADPVLVVPFWTLGPGTELPGERLRFLLTANTVDARDPAGPRFEPVGRAVALGARTGGPADVTLPDGTSAWADGGPLEPHDPASTGGHPVVPRPHLVAGRLLAVGADRAPTAALAPDQLAAVAHIRGPARIIAPAGSGKTRVLTERTRHLVRDRDLTAAAVSLVAYNRRARDEMVARLGDVPGLDIRTLNSLALAIANGDGPFRRPRAGGGRRTIDERAARDRLEQFVQLGRRRANTDPLEEWVDALAAARLGLRSPDDIEDEYPGVTDFERILGEYRDDLRRRGELDFDEQILAALEVLLTDPGARETARAACPVLLIDEFQDLTPAHLLLVRLLAGPACEVFAVGDDDQTIYGYAGASPDWLVDFTRWFPGAADHPLTVNYRCPPEVVDAAVNLLSHNRRRVRKEIHAAPGREPDGHGLVVRRTAEPHLDLVAHVTALLAGGVPAGHIAVLSRVNAALLPPLVHLEEAGVPVRRPPGLSVSLLTRSGTRAALAWLRLAAAPEQRLDSADLADAVRRPPRGLSGKLGEWIAEQRSVKELHRLAGRLASDRDADKVTGFADDLTRLRQAAEAGADAARLLDLVYDDIGLLGAASQLDSAQRAARRAAHSDELLALRAVAELHPDPSTLGPWLEQRLAAPRPTDAADGPAGVTLNTIHTTKGLEWPHVVVHDVRSGLYPHQLATDVEEERRIFHVGITRASASVLVTVTDPPSPFVGQLAEARAGDLPWPAEPTPASPAAAPGGGRRSAPAPAPTVPDTPEAHALRDLLKRWRAERAKGEGVPAYVVFSDATLDAIVVATPGSLAALGRVKGIGPAKLDRYGDEILGIIADHGG